MKQIVAACLGVALLVDPAGAQMRTVDPNEAGTARVAPSPDEAPRPAEPVPPASPEAPPTAPPPSGAEARASAEAGNTYQRGDVLAAAEGVFGKGAAGLAKLIEKVLKDQGEPNAYIAGREAGAAIAVGLRYGSGKLFHKVEGERDVYWTGPSIGFDLGANGAKTFTLVYNLDDGQELFQRFPAVEGQAYYVGGFTASYLRSGNIVVIPIRLGVGLRLGANVGYMKFTEKSTWLPF